MSGSLSAEKKLVSVVVPIYNEERYIAGVIESVLRQDYGMEHMEILLVDGCSSDRTVEIIQQYQSAHPGIQLLNNPKRTVQSALNIGVRAAAGEYIVRLDAHAEFAPDYVSKSIEILERTDAEDVGGPMIARWKTPVQRAMAAAYHSPFVVGDCKNHKEGYEGYADTVFLGAFRRQYLLDIGAYDERLPCNEDDDLTFRMTERGDKIYISSDIKSIYYPRDSYRALFKQRFRYGYWKVAVAKKHGRPARRVGHLIPLCFFLFLLIFAVLSVFFTWCRILYGAVLGLYMILNLVFSICNPYTHSAADVLRLFWIHFIIHLSYGIGYFCGIVPLFAPEILTPAAITLSLRKAWEPHGSSLLG